MEDLEREVKRLAEAVLALQASPFAPVALPPPPPAVLPTVVIELVVEVDEPEAPQVVTDRLGRLESDQMSLTEAVAALNKESERLALEGGNRVDETRALARAIFTLLDELRIHDPQVERAMNLAGLRRFRNGR